MHVDELKGKINDNTPVTEGTLTPSGDYEQRPWTPPGEEPAPLLQDAGPFGSESSDHSDAEETTEE